ncbi:4-(cytidine 5'-diphospho)-2-C-methyl-D-erythritol kinase [Chloroflexota bacterium]
MLNIETPAKINLTLEVLGKRGDGYHEIRSIIQPISLCDILHFELNDDISIESDMPGWTAEESLVLKTVNLLKEATGCRKGVNIQIEKHIPLVSGLGGDSSDAAVVIRGLNRLWELELSIEQMFDLAGQLGSDVYYFLAGGSVLAEGRGEILTPLPSLPHKWIVLAVPPVTRLRSKTKQLYDSLEASHYTDGQITDRLVEVMKAGRGFEPSYLFNTFENVAFTLFSELNIAREHFIKLGAPFVHLAGSGPTLFTLLDDEAKAEELCSLLKTQNMEAYLAEL